MTDGAIVEGMIVEAAPAKINLALHVRHRRDDGYHALETLFAFCRHGDVVRVTPAGQDSFAITGPFAGGLEGDNLVTRARDAFAARFGVAGGHRIVLDKRLPVASGIGGGSADAAATLRALARLYPVDAHALFEIAAGLGADVPACLLGVPSFGTGRGDELAPLVPLGDLPVLLVNPRVPVSTASVFAGWDGVDRGAVPGGETFARALAGRNDLEPPARRLAPAIDDVLARLCACGGVRMARMSGSGATCFAVFDTPAARDTAQAAIGDAMPSWWRLATTLA